MNIVMFASSYLFPSYGHGSGMESEPPVLIGLGQGDNAKRVFNEFNRLKSRWLFPTNCIFLKWLLDTSAVEGEERRMLKSRLESRTVDPTCVVSTSSSTVPSHLAVTVPLAVGPTVLAVAVPTEPLNRHHPAVLPSTVQTLRPTASDTIGNR